MSAIPTSEVNSESKHRRISEDHIIRELGERLALLQLRPRDVPEVTEGATMGQTEKPTPPAIVNSPRGKWAVTKKLGSGGFASVYEVQNAGGQKLAFKVMRSSQERKEVMRKLCTEMQIHAKLNHANIVKFHYAFAYEDLTYIAMELCTGKTLRDVATQKPSLERVRKHTYQICDALRYLHKFGVLHRDIKLANTFLDAQDNVKIGDFGLAGLVLPDNDKLEKVRRLTKCGTPNYMAPEMYSEGNLVYNSKVDVYAVGCLVFALLTGGTPPFQKAGQAKEVERQRKLDQDYQWPTNMHISPIAMDFVDQCLLADKRERPEIDVAIQHEFLKADGMDYINQLSSLSLESPKKMWSLCAKEVEMGTSPTVPMKNDTIYEWKPPVQRQVLASVAPNGRAIRPVAQTAASLRPSPIFGAHDKQHLVERCKQSEIVEQIQITALNIRAYLRGSLPPSHYGNLADPSESSHHVQVRHRSLDHHKKKGIAYALQDGTVGALFPSSHPMTSIVHPFALNHHQLRHNQNAVGHYQHLKAACDPAAPEIEFFQRYPTNDTLRRVKVPVTEMGQPAFKQRDKYDTRKKKDLNTWCSFADDFGRQYANRGQWPYTHPTDADAAASGHDTAATTSPTPIVLVCQRMGNVTIWLFSNLVMQFEFENDRSRMIVSPQGSYVTFRYWAAWTVGGKLTRQPAKLHVPVQELLYGDSDNGVLEDARESHGAAEKIAFVYDVLKMWWHAKEVGSQTFKYEYNGLTSPGWEGDENRQEREWWTVVL